MPLDITRIRADFPILSQSVHGTVPLVYLDSAATAQKPNVVIDAEAEFYRTANAAVHRGAHALAEAATERFEWARATIAAFIGAAPANTVLTKNATEAINLVAYGFSNATAKSRMGVKLLPGEERFVLEPGDEIVVSEMEHHANLVPWQEVALKTGAVLTFIPVTDAGRLDIGAAASLIGPRTKVVSLVHQSNILAPSIRLPKYSDWPNVSVRGQSWMPANQCRICPWSQANLVRTSWHSVGTRCAVPSALASSGEPTKRWKHFRYSSPAAP